jgi:hypothetical protein
VIAGTSRMAGEKRGSAPTRVRAVWRWADVIRGSWVGLGQRPATTGAGAPCLSHLGAFRSRSSRSEMAATDSARVGARAGDR